VDDDLDAVVRHVEQQAPDHPRPLFIRVVAELTVITGPIAQVGWARASAGVTSARSAAERHGTAHRRR
jgi:hypothetical protein